MVFTRAEGKAALEHIIENVFELPCDGPLAKALLAMHVKDNIRDVIVMPFEDVESLVYTKDQGNEVALKKPFCWMIHVLKHYHLYCISERNPIGDDWVPITAQEYQDYWMSAAYAETHKASMPIALSSSSLTTPRP